MIPPVTTSYNLLAVIDLQAVDESVCFLVFSLSGLIRIIVNTLFGSVNRLSWTHVQCLRDGLAFTAHNLVYHSTLGMRVIEKKNTRLTHHL